MTTAAEREGLREALAAAILKELARGKDTSVYWIADALITGPLAETLAQADTAARMADDLVAVGLRNLALSAEVEALRGALEDTRAAADDLVPVCLQEGDNRAAGALQYVSGFISDRLAALAAGQDKEGGKPSDPTPQKERADG